MQNTVRFKVCTALKNHVLPSWYASKMKKKKQKSEEEIEKRVVSVPPEKRKKQIERKKSDSFENGKKCVFHHRKEVGYLLRSTFEKALNFFYVILFLFREHTYFFFFGL